MHGVSSRDTDSSVLVLEKQFMYSRTSEGDTDYQDPVSLTGLGQVSNICRFSFNLGHESGSQGKA